MRPLCLAFGIRNKEYVKATNSSPRKYRNGARRFACFPRSLPRRPVDFCCRKSSHLDPIHHRSFSATLIPSQLNVSGCMSKWPDAGFVRRPDRPRDSLDIFRQLGCAKRMNTSGIGYWWCIARFVRQSRSTPTGHIRCSHYQRRCGRCHENRMIGCLWNHSTSPSFTATICQTEVFTGKMRQAGCARRAQMTSDMVQQHQ